MTAVAASDRHRAAVRRAHRRAGLVLELVATGAVVVGALALGSGPEVGSPRAASLAVALAGGTVMAGGTACGLLGLFHLVAALATRSGATWPGRTGHPLLRRAIHGFAGVGVVAATVAHPGVAGASPADTPITVTDHPDGPHEGSSVAGDDPLRPADDDTVDRATLVVLPPADPEPASPQVLPSSTWRVSTGENWWSISETVLTGRLGRPATDAEIAPVWRALIGQNSDRLVDGDDPDLILPGQVFDVALDPTLIAAVSGGGAPPRSPGDVPSG